MVIKMNSVAMQRLIILMVIMLTFVSCKNQNETFDPGEDDLVVTLDTEMVKRLFPDGKNILTGSDGAISFPIDNESSFWLWGDSFFGEVVDNKWDKNTTPFVMGNIWQILEKDTVKLIIGGDVLNPSPLIKAENVEGNPAVLWPMHGFVKNDIVHIFLSSIVFTGTKTFDFYWNSTEYYRLNLSDMSIIDREVILDRDQTEVHFGFGVFEHGGYYYSYGSTPKDNFSSKLGVSRAKLINDKLTDWEFFDGEKWVKDALASAPVEGVDVPVSEQFSVFKQGDKFILLTQDRFKPEIYTFIADKPEGPFYNKKLHYNIPEAEDLLLFTYNAMAHPQYDKDGQLLVSYCVNAWDPNNLYENASIYKPRFLRIPYPLILE